MIKDDNQCVLHEIFVSIALLSFTIPVSPHLPSLIMLPELLSMIFSHITHSQLKIICCVCKLWFKASSALLWRKVVIKSAVAEPDLGRMRAERRVAERGKEA